MSLKKKSAKKKTNLKKAVKVRAIKVVKGKKPRAVKFRSDGGKSKAVRRKPTAKKAGFEAKTVSLHSELRLVRQALEKNDSALSKKIGEKIRLENSLNSLLSRNFAAEKELLLTLKASSFKKQDILRKEISSLEKINKVYEEKKARIDQAKSKQNALKKQLQLLEKKVGI